MVFYLESWSLSAPLLFNTWLICNIFPPKRKFYTDYAGPKMKDKLVNPIIYFGKMLFYLDDTHVIYTHCEKKKDFFFWSIKDFD